MAGTIIVSSIKTDTDNSFIVRSNTGATLFSVDTTSISIPDGSITSAMIANGTVIAADVADGSITAAKLAPGAALPSQTSNATYYLTSDGTNAIWKAQTALTVANTQITGNITSSQIVPSLTLYGNVSLNDSSGSLAIGTSSVSSFASGKLVVVNSADNFVSLQAGTTNASGINMVDSATGSAVGLIRYQHSSDAMDFFTNGSQRMLIDSSGRLFLNGTSVIAGYQFIMYHNDTGGMAYKYNGTSEQNSCSFQNGNGQVGRIYTSGSSTTYATSSDYRLKENIVPMTGALDKVTQLNPVTYTWKTDGSAGQGFIAHELQAVVPDCVGGTKDAVDAEGNPIYQDIDTSFLVATLTAAIKEQQTIINNLKTRIEALEGQ